MKKLISLMLMLGVFSFGAYSQNQKQVLDEITYTILEEGFESGACPPAGWTQYQMATPMGWQIWNFENSGEWSARYYSDYGESHDDWLVSPQLYITGQTTLTFYSWMGEHNICTIHVSTGSADPADGEYIEVLNLPNQGWSWNEMIIDLSEYTGSEVYIAFRGNIPAVEGVDWTIDDILVETTAQAGVISGTVLLDGGSGNVQDVLISAGPLTSNPDNNGYYELQIGEGTYDVTANLDGYDSELVGNVTVVAGQSTANVDFTLIVEEIVINPPRNVSVDAQTGIVYWDSPELPNGMIELAYEDGDPSFAVNEYGRAFGVHMTVDSPCQLMSIKYFTYAEADTMQFEAYIYNMAEGSPTDEILWSNMNVTAVAGNWTEVDLTEYSLMVESDFLPAMKAWEPIALFADVDQSNERSWDGFPDPWTLTNNTYYIRAVVKYADGSLVEVDQNGNREIISYNVFLDNMVSPVFTDITWEAEQFPYLENGTDHVAGVSAVYQAGESEIIEVPFTYTGVTPGISGTITLSENGNGNVEDVELLINNQFVSPDAEGMFGIDLLPGTYSITATLTDYEQQTIGEIEVKSAEITTVNIDMISYLTAENINSTDFGITSVYPVPVKSSATIAYDISEAQRINVSVYDLSGQFVSCIISDFCSVGSYQHNWNATDMNGNRVKSGVYILEMKGYKNILKKKIIVL
ncbi:MAG: choice-of-anchor J domain-containing protein [Bacteroidales bacterium]|nr:choice-of-anchor J domain-containing protein [Bacteroidales bacterium]